MAHIALSPRGVSLPYSSLFNLALRDQPRPTATSSQPTIDGCLGSSSRRPSPDIKPPSRAHSKPAKPLRFTRIRRIAFKAFSPSPDPAGRPKRSHNTVTTTEIVARQSLPNPLNSTDKPKPNRSIFKAWRFKSSPSKSQLKKTVGVLKTPISASSPPDQHPKTWDEYNRLYANEEIDVINPPPPPPKPSTDSEPTIEFYPAPRPANERVRQLVVNRLAVLGGKPFDPSEQGAMEAKARIERGDALSALGKAPHSLDLRWLDEHGHHTPSGITGELPPRRLANDTLEQHPIFRNIVKRCRELFGSALSMLSILDDDRQVFLAESGASEAGMEGMRDVTRDISFCAHTILGGRKGMTVLDVENDWRFGNGPLVHDLGARFYAGVPLMAPNMDGSQEAEENACPIGTLCILDFEAREAFSAEDEQKLAYISEYARREIERWFASKIKLKTERLAATQEAWADELKRVASPISEGDESAGSELLSSPGSPPLRSPTSSHLSSSFRKWRSISSISTAPPSSPSASVRTSPKLAAPGRPSLFEDLNGAVKPKMRKVFDLATKLVAETLELSLVYLMAVEPPGGSEDQARTLIISGHNLPLPVPALDAGLHLRVLRAGEGGLLYQNPSVEEAGRAPLVRPTPGAPYASALLLAVVGNPPPPDAGGFVLAGFAADPKRVFGAEDVSFMAQFAAQLAPYTARLPLASSSPLPV